MSDDPRSEKKPGAPEVKEPARETGRLLYIDDDPDACQLVTEILRSNKLAADSVTSAKEGLNRLEELDYDLIICDLNMPGMDGSDFYRCLRRDYPELADRFMLSTGESDTRVYHAFRDTKPPEVLYKPLNVPELLRRVSERMAEIQDEAQPPPKAPGSASADD